MINDHDRLSMETALQHLCQAHMRCFELCQRYPKLCKSEKQIAKAMNTIKEAIYQDMIERRK